MRRSLRQTSVLFLLAPLAAAATALTPGATALASPTSDTAQAVETSYRGPLALGAAPTKYTQTVAGQDMIIPVTGLTAGALAKVSAANAALPAGWQIHLINESSLVPNALVSASAAQPITSAGVGRWIFVPFAPGTTGSVDLQVLAG